MLKGLQMFEVKNDSQVRKDFWKGLRDKHFTCFRVKARDPIEDVQERKVKSL